jgi:hypothetical protein
MMRFLKTFAWAALLASAVNVSLGFSLIGPNNEPYQVPDLGYNPVGRDPLPIAPKNLGEEYRRNTPVMYYSFDANFLDYFGSNGVYAVDQAFGVFNSLTNFSSYSCDLSEFAFNSVRQNFLAESLLMIDLKAFTMNLIIENLGLAQPERYIFAEKNRVLLPGGTCPPNMLYLIIKRNFNPFTCAVDQTQSKYTSYLNDVLYSYFISELCTAPVEPVSETINFPVDPLANPGIAVASLGGGGSSFISDVFGAFFLGLTRDDVGGLRYLYATNNVNFENAGPGTVTLVTNNNASLLNTSNLAVFAEQALTNPPGTLQALYPDLAILSVSNSFATVPITNTIAFFTNFPYDPAGTPPHLVLSNSVTYTVQTLFHYTFGNLFRIQLGTNGYIASPLFDLNISSNHDFTTLQTIVATNSAFTPAGSSPVPQTFNKTMVTNRISGEFVILPTNFCDIAILAAQITNVITDSNFVFFSTNIFISNTSTNTQFILQNRLDYSTNHTFVVYPVICVSSNATLTQGIEKMSFVRRDFDSLLGRFFYPITNEYTLNSITNNRIVTQRVRRVVTIPDFLLTAQDLTVGPAQLPLESSAVARNINFNTGFAGQGLAGPGTIEPETIFVYNKVGPIFINPFLINSNAFFDETTQVPFDFVWGSFDGTTNPPIVYPTGASINDLESQVLIQVTPYYLPDGTAGSPYNAQLQTVATPNWQSPFTWSLNSNFPALPPGLTITNDMDIGMISGTPSQSGFFDFVVHITDAAGRGTDRGYSIKIGP